MWRRVLLAFLLAAFISSAAMAQGFLGLPGFSGTPQEQAACRRDVARFCKSYSPDEMLVLNCLRRERARITAACRMVLENHGQ